MLLLACVLTIRTPEEMTGASFPPPILSVQNLSIRCYSMCGGPTAAAAAAEWLLGQQQRWIDGHERLSFQNPLYLFFGLVIK